MNHRSFCVSSLSESELTALANAIEQERAKRVAQKEAARAVWIEQHARAFQRTYHSTCVIRENLTIVAVYDEMEGIGIGTAYPVNGDAYDYKTGVAVAFAKAVGETIPDYI